MICNSYVGVLAVSLGALGLGATLLAARPPVADDCATGLDVQTLSSRDRGFVAQHVMACHDVEHDRISADNYRARISKLDAAWSAAPVIPPAPPVMQWASSVRGVSSQYSATSWSAQAVLGPPDVYPASGDNARAWASLTADGAPEWIEVAFAQPTSISAVDIFETYNPGAIQTVHLITTSGQDIVARSGRNGLAAAGSQDTKIAVGCTQEPIAAVRVELDSQAVPGWNELDAIGVLPCTQQ